MSAVSLPPSIASLRHEAMRAANRWAGDTCGCDGAVHADRVAVSDYSALVNSVGVQRAEWVADKMASRSVAARNRSLIGAVLVAACVVVAPEVAAVALFAVAVWVLLSWQAEGDSKVMDGKAVRRWPMPETSAGRAMQMAAAGTIGKAGTGLVDTFGEGAGGAGVKGEQFTAELIEPFSALPHVTVFHSVQMPGTNGDIDHVVLVGGLMLMIDSKMWRAGAYSAAPGGTVFRDGVDAGIGCADGYFASVAAPQLAALTGSVLWAAATVVHGNVDISQMPDAGSAHSYINAGQLVDWMVQQCSQQRAVLNVPAFETVRSLVR